MRALLLALVALVVACGGSDSLSEEAYLTQVLDDVINPILTALERLDALGEESTRRPALIVNDAWQRDMRQQTAVLRSAHDETEQLDPPGRYAESQQILLRATECLADYADEMDAQLVRGLDGVYAGAHALLDGCIALIGDATDALDRAQ